MRTKCFGRVYSENSILWMIITKSFLNFLLQCKISNISEFLLKNSSILKCSLYYIILQIWKIIIVSICPVFTVSNKRTPFSYIEVESGHESKHHIYTTGTKFFAQSNFKLSFAILNGCCGCAVWYSIVSVQVFEVMYKRLADTA